MEVREIQVVDRNFILPIVDGYGHEVLELEVDQEYRFIKKPNYILLLRQDETQKILPMYAATAGFQQEKGRKSHEQKRGKGTQKSHSFGYVESG